MRISNQISELDLTVVINKEQVAKMIYQFRPKTFFNQKYPEQCLVDVDESTDGYFLQDSNFLLTLEDVNEAFETDYSSLNEFFETFNADDFLIIE